MAEKSKKTLIYLKNEAFTYKCEARQSYHETLQELNENQKKMEYKNYYDTLDTLLVYEIEFWSSVMNDTLLPSTYSKLQEYSYKVLRTSEIYTETINPKNTNEINEKLKLFKTYAIQYSPKSRTIKHKLNRHKKLRG